MKCIWRKNFYLGTALLLLLLCSRTRAQQAGEEQHNDLNVQGVVKALGRLPIIGPPLETTIIDLENEFLKMDNATFGILSGLLNGVLPCTITTTSFHCDETELKDNVHNIVTNLINSIPSNILPDMFKGLANQLVGSLVDTAVDALVSLTT